jgi:CBS domain-containing protein
MPKTTDDPKEGNVTGDESASKKGFSGLPKAVTQLGQSGLAILLIIPAFILIGVMLVMQSTAVNSSVGQVSNALDGNNSADTIRELSTFFQQVNASNQNMFSIILTVFGTWVGAVVAFYFGTQNLRQSQESFNKVGQVLDNTITKMSQAPRASETTTYKTIDDLIKKYPKAGDVLTVNMDDTIKTVKAKFMEKQDIDNVVVLDIDEEGEKVVRGILYRVDLIEEIGVGTNFEEAGPLDDVKLRNEITKIKTDSATNKPWTAGEVENYVIVPRDYTIEAAIADMNAKGNEKIRCLVWEEEHPIAIFSLQDLTS